MEAISTVLTVLSIIIWIVSKVSNSSSSSSSSSTVPEYDITANLKVDPALINQLNLGAGDAVTLECINGQDVNVIVQGSSWTPVSIGTISDIELSHKVRQKLARAKIFTINGDLVTVEFKYA